MGFIIKILFYYKIFNFWDLNRVFGGSSGGVVVFVVV